MRWILGLVASFVVVAAVAADVAAAPFETRRLRAVAEWNAVYVEINATAGQFPDAAGKLQKAANLAQSANPQLDGDLDDLIQVNALVGKAVHGPLQPQTLKDAFAELGTKLMEITSLVLDDFEEEIATFVSVNPDRKVTKQEKALRKARAIVAKAAEKPPLQYGARAGQLRKALAAIRSQKLFPFVSKARKGECVGGSRIPLQKGEYAYGPWAIYDFDSQSVEATWFEANWGSAVVAKDDQGTPTHLSLYFGYCDGRSKSVTSVECSIANPGEGTFGLGNSVGGYHRGLGFGINMTTGSTLTITSLNLEDGFVAGKIDFVATNGTGRGTAEFVMRIDP